jgi:hypothetical protein
VDALIDTILSPTLPPLANENNRNLLTREIEIDFVKVLKKLD